MPAPEKIKVLIVDDINETRENIRRMLQFDTNIEVVGAARTGREAIEMAQQLLPDVVVMDINMPDMDGITATENIRRKVPFAQVIILSVQNDSSYMRRAMLAGARDFLSKPPMIDELTSAIRQAAVVAHEERSKAAPPAYTAAPGGMPTLAGMMAGSAQHKGRVIVVYSPKGGTGCTTIATNLAIALHKPDAPAAVIDGSLQFGDVAVALNEQGKNTILDLAPRVDEMDADVVREVMVVQNTTGVSMLAAPPRPEMAEKVNGEQFGKVLRFLQSMYSWIVVDTSSYLSEPVLEALNNADITILVTTQEFPAIKNCNLFLSLIDLMRIPRDSIIFVMNRYDKRITIPPEKVGESLRQPIMLVLPLEEKVSYYLNRGISFFVDNKTLPISKSIQALADLVQEHINKPKAGQEGSSDGRRK
ncbi:MAG TPA: response regulator [Anaerolineaceae bacterium]|jgi:pilus assembly protein CpaE|nr:response regulator [Anaerolineaceae bacterium]HQF63062.1 response regulator [Anaerolineaceae bacterium]HQH86048.1 response regulator [Anaerolineaceae bacterium]